jgi:hypothetical protein
MTPGLVAAQQPVYITDDSERHGLAAPVSLYVRIETASARFPCDWRLRDTTSRSALFGGTGVKQVISSQPNRSPP